jgi:toxin YoeB
MPEIIWTKEAAKDLDYWRKHHIATAKRIKALIESIQKDPFKGIGKPEPLRFSLAGSWSRRISKEHRLVYQVSKTNITIISCKYHY